MSREFGHLKVAFNGQTGKTFSLTITIPLDHIQINKRNRTQGGDGNRYHGSLGHSFMVRHDRNSQREFILTRGARPLTLLEPSEINKSLTSIEF